MLRKQPSPDCASCSRNRAWLRVGWPPINWPSMTLLNRADLASCAITLINIRKLVMPFILLGCRHTWNEPSHIDTVPYRVSALATGFRRYNRLLSGASTLLPSMPPADRKSRLASRYLGGRSRDTAARQDRSGRREIHLVAGSVPQLRRCLGTRLSRGRYRPTLEL
jgi:hypothetical protein